ENQKVPLETETKDHGTALPWWFRALCFTYSAVGLNMVLRVQAMSCSCPQELPVARRGGPAAAPGRALLLARRVLRRELPSRKDRRQDDFGHVPHLLPAAQIHILPHGRGAARVALRLLVAGSALFSRRQDAERTPPGTRAATTCCTRCGTWRCRWEASSGSSTPAAHSRGTCGRMPRRGGPRTSLHWAAARPRPCRSIGPPPRAAAVPRTTGHPCPGPLLRAGLALCASGASRGGRGGGGRSGALCCGEGSAPPSSHRRGSTHRRCLPSRGRSSRRRRHPDTRLLAVAFAAVGCDGLWHPSARLLLSRLVCMHHLGEISFTLFLHALHRPPNVWSRCMPCAVRQRAHRAEVKRGAASGPACN
ncbi:unnamed protein product, partial [Prorocentrum cordatum]